MSKIFKFNEFVLNEAVSTKQVIEDVVDFFKKSPVIELYPEDKGDVVREGWLSKEHKLYSLSGIKKHFKEKYSSLNIENAINYTPSIKILTKMLADDKMSLQTTKLKGQFGDTNIFYSVNLTDSEIKSVKEKYEKEFAKRYDKYLTSKKEAPKKAAAARLAKEEAKKTPAKKTAKKRITKKAEKKNEAFELLIERLFSL